MCDSFLHDHSCDLNSVLLSCDFFDEIDLVKWPFILVDGDLGLELDLEGVKLSDFQKIIFFGIASFDADTKSILFCEVVDFYDL